jgi:hypothetical protein
MLDPTGKAAQRRRLLEEYIRDSQRVRWYLRAGLLVFTPAALIAWWFEPRIGVSVFTVTLAVVGIGYYITGAHMAEWRHELESEDNTRDQSGL